MEVSIELSSLINSKNILNLNIKIYKIFKNNYTYTGSCLYTSAAAPLQAAAALCSDASACTASILSKIN